MSKLEGPIQRAAGRPAGEADRLPSRKTRFPSQRGRWTRLFVQSLVVIFIALIAVIIVLYKHYPAFFSNS